MSEEERWQGTLRVNLKNTQNEVRQLRSILSQIASNVLGQILQCGLPWTLGRMAYKAVPRMVFGSCSLMIHITYIPTKLDSTKRTLQYGFRSKMDTGKLPLK